MGKRVSLWGIFCLIFTSTLLAQGTTSRATGVVQDPTGAPVANAAVKLINEGTQAPFATRTSETGNYVFEAVQPGVYTVDVSASGFKEFVSKGNVLSIGRPMTLNVTLELGSVTETVEVSSSYELVETSTSGNLGNLFSDRIIMDLPIVGTRGRNPLDLVLLQPGVVNGANTGGGIHVLGARDRAWNYTLDGIDVNETSAGGSDFSPLHTNPDSLAEFKVITSNATAEYGRNSGGEVTMITRSGSNEIHGEGFWFYRTPRLNAGEWGDNTDAIGKAQFVQQIFGGSIGGPIIRNRTFFFANVQALRALNTDTPIRTVLTGPARQGILRYVKGGRNRPAGVPGAAVDFSGNPLAAVSTGTYNVAASDPQRLGLDKTIQSLIQQSPLPNRFDVGDGLNTAGYAFTDAQQERQHDQVIKIDQAISSKHWLYFRAAWGSQDTNCDHGNSGERFFPGSPCLVNTQREPRNLAFNWRWNPTARLTNEFVVGQNRFTFNFVTPTADITKVSLNAPLNIELPISYDYGNLRTLKTLQFVDNAGYFRGAHSFKFGTTLRLQQHIDTRGSIASSDATTDVDFDPGVNTVDPATFGLPADLNTSFDQPNFQSAINLLLGRVGTITRGFISKGDQFTPGLYNFDGHFNEYDFYAQDTWKVRKNLTVDLGLRWEIKLSPTDPEGRIRRPDQPVAAGAPPSDTLRWVPGKLYNDDYHALGPSVGIAWDPQGRGKTSIRANYRLAYDRINTFVLSSQLFQNFPGITYGLATTEPGQSGGRLSSVQPLAPPAVKPADFAQPPAFSNSAITVVDPSFKTPTTHEFGFSIQHEIGKSAVFEADYIGRRAYHLIGAYNANQAQIFNNGFVQAFKIVQAGGESDLINRLTAADSRRGAAESGSQMVRRLFASQLNLNSVAAVANSIGARVQGGKSVTSLSGAGLFPIIPYPQFGGGLNVIDSNDFSTYHAMILQVERRLRDGLEFQVSYTLSKSLDTRSFDPAFSVVRTGALQSAANTPVDIYNRRLNYGPSDFDRTHVIQSHWLYELPYGRGKRFGGGAPGVLDRIFGGWEIAGILTVASGRPFTVYSGANTVTNVRQTPANCSGCDRHLGQVFDDASGYKFFFNDAQRNKFSTPGPGEFGNTGRNYFRYSRFLDMDMSLLKHVRLTERFRLELRADATNLTNTPSFSVPTATVTSTTFGRIKDSLDSTSRHVQLGAKLFF